MMGAIHSGPKVLFKILTYAYSRNNYFSRKNETACFRTGFLAEVHANKYTSETGIKYRMNRSIQVEGVFRVLKNDYEFQRFLLRGQTKVKD